MSRAASVAAGNRIASVSGTSDVVVEPATARGATVFTPREHAFERVVAVVKRFQVSTWFLILAVPMGLFLVFAVPPFQGLDEPDHFYRAYTITEGALVTPLRGYRAGESVPTCVVMYVNYQFRRAGGPGPFHKSEFIKQPERCSPALTTFVYFEGSAFYSPIAYLPQTLGLKIARSLHASAPVLFYAGRLAALLAYICLTFVTLHIAPRGRSVVLLVATWPMTLLLAATYSADTLTIGLALLLIACVLRSFHDPRATWRLFAVAFAAALALALCKSTYYVLAILLLLIPQRLFQSRLVSWAAKMGALTVIAVVSVIWFLQVRGISAAAYFPPAALNPREQLTLIIHDPVWYVKFMAAMLLGEQAGMFTWQTFVAQIGFFRSWAPGQPFPPPWVMVVGYVILVQAYIREAAPPYTRSLSAVAKAALPLAIIVINTVLIVTAVYVESVPVRTSFVAIQGRYFLPLVAVPLVSLSVLSVGAFRQRSVLPLIPFVVLMYVWLVIKVNQIFY